MSNDPLLKAQQLFDRLEALKTDRRAKIRERREGLEAIGRYKEIQTEAGKLRESRKLIEKDWDESNESTVAEIESLETKIDSTRFSLTNAMLEAIKAGAEVKITKTGANGQPKKMHFEFKVNFSQTTLGL